MIKRKGNLFDTTAKAVGHGVNTEGVMGSGIAVEFKNRFPKNYQAYRNACLTGLFQPGEAFVYVEDGMTIANIASQKHPGPNAAYSWLLTASVDAALNLMDFHHIDTLAIPLIGCGIGGLEWPAVEYVLRAVEIIVPNFEFEVWRL